MKVWKLRSAINNAEELMHIFADRKGSYSIRETEADMIRDVCRFILTMDTMYVQLKSDERYERLEM